jgi:hypothetical protein
MTPRVYCFQPHPDFETCGDVVYRNQAGVSLMQKLDEAPHDHDKIKRDNQAIKKDIARLKGQMSTYPLSIPRLF